MAAIVAVGVNTDGRREALGMDIGPSEAGPFRTAFLRKLARRGLRGVKLVISDAHEGLKAAIAKVLSATWQRCRVHFMRNALAHAGRSGRRVVSVFVATAFARDDADTARQQWHRVADQLRPKVPKLAALMRPSLEGRGDPQAARASIASAAIRQPAPRPRHRRPCPAAPAGAPDGGIPPVPAGPLDMLRCSMICRVMFVQQNKGSAMRITLALAAIMAAVFAVAAPASAADDVSGRALACVAEAVYFEARGEPARGRAAVAHVILNRADSPGFPDTPCGVVAEGCQFSYRCDGRPERLANRTDREAAFATARAVLTGAVPDPTNGALFFHARRISPSWFETRDRTRTIGNHVFYR